MTKLVLILTLSMQTTYVVPMRLGGSDLSEEGSAVEDVLEQVDEIWDYEDALSKETALFTSEAIQSEQLDRDTSTPLGGAPSGSGQERSGISINAQESTIDSAASSSVGKARSFEIGSTTQSRSTAAPTAGLVPASLSQSKDLSASKDVSTRGSSSGNVEMPSGVVISVSITGVDNSDGKAPPSEAKLGQAASATTREGEPRVSQSAPPAAFMKAERGAVPNAPRLIEGQGKSTPPGVVQAVRALAGYPGSLSESTFSHPGTGPSESGDLPFEMGGLPRGTKGVPSIGSAQGSTPSTPAQGTYSPLVAREKGTPPSELQAVTDSSDWSTSKATSPEPVGNGPGVWPCEVSGLSQESSNSFSIESTQGSLPPTELPGDPYPDGWPAFDAPAKEQQAKVALASWGSAEDRVAALESPNIGTALATHDMDAPSGGALFSDTGDFMTHSVGASPPSVSSWTAQGVSEAFANPGQMGLRESQAIVGSSPAPETAQLGTVPCASPGNLGPGKKTSSYESKATAFSAAPPGSLPAPPPPPPLALRPGGSGVLPSEVGASPQEVTASSLIGSAQGSPPSTAAEGKWIPAAQAKLTPPYVPQAAAYPGDWSASKATLAKPIGNGATRVEPFEPGGLSQESSIGFSIGNASGGSFHTELPPNASLGGWFPPKAPLKEQQVMGTSAARGSDKAASFANTFAGAASATPVTDGSQGSLVFSRAGSSSEVGLGSFGAPGQGGKAGSESHGSSLGPDELAQLAALPSAFSEPEEPEKSTPPFELQSVDSSAANSGAWSASMATPLGPGPGGPRVPQSEVDGVSQGTTAGSSSGSAQGSLPSAASQGSVSPSAAAHPDVASGGLAKAGFAAFAIPDGMASANQGTGGPQGSRPALSNGGDFGTSSPGRSPASGARGTALVGSEAFATSSEATPQGLQSTIGVSVEYRTTQIGSESDATPAHEYHANSEVPASVVGSSSPIVSIVVSDSSARRSSPQAARVWGKGEPQSEQQSVGVSATNGTAQAVLAALATPNTGTAFVTPGTGGLAGDFSTSHATPLFGSAPSETSGPGRLMEPRALPSEVGLAVLATPGPDRLEDSRLLTSFSTGDGTAQPGSLPGLEGLPPLANIGLTQEGSGLSIGTVKVPGSPPSTERPQDIAQSSQAAGSIGVEAKETGRQTLDTKSGASAGTVQTEGYGDYTP
eukprot:TRINITY_DN40723_c0_g1_i1.p1 TRINITY_DN40723_c0_g1~~TRINITY_DN40723_c0_g1_i1.p1  ORF type:complete len:1185 (+),score=121.72 TRINITY_DN40723_c0_g1_i1:61-3615(+)